MTAVAQEMLELADAYEAGLKKMRASGYEEFGLEIQRKHELIIIALRESALSRNAKVTERMI